LAHGKADFVIDVNFSGLVLGVTTKPKLQTAKQTLNNSDAL
jgi:hypothetical protein